MRLYNPAIFALLVMIFIIWFIVEVVIPFIVEVVFPIVGVVTIIFLIGVATVALIRVLGDVTASFSKVRYARLAAAPVLLHDEAVLGYAFGPAWEDMSAFFRECFNGALKHVSTAAENVGKADTFLEGVYHSTDWVFSVTFGFLITALVTAFLALLAGIAAIFLALTFVLLYLIDLAFISFRGWIVRCPTCHHNGFHLHYDCPHCGRKHRHLYPNRAGALFHTCRCEKKIPSHILSGRGRKMQAYCALKEHPIGEELIGTRVTHVALVGGPDSGKSTLLVGILRLLLKDTSFRGRNFALEDKVQEKMIDGQINDLDAGICPPKTTKQRHRATTVVFKDGPKDRRSLYFFDTSGEMFSDTKLKAQHIYFDSSDFILFALDPLSLRGFLDHAQTVLGSDRLREASPSRENPEAVASSLITLMDASGAKRSNGRFDAPLALVLTKSDIIQTERSVYSYSPEQSAEKIAEWIKKFGGAALLRLLEANFNDIRLRQVSPLNAPDFYIQLPIKNLTWEIVEHKQLNARSSRLPWF